MTHWNELENSTVGETLDDTVDCIFLSTDA